MIKAQVMFHYSNFLLQPPLTSWVSTVFPVVLVVLTVAVLDYYAEAVCVSRLEVSRGSRIAAIAVFSSAILLSVFWNHPFVTQV